MGCLSPHLSLGTSCSALMTVHLDAISAAQQSILCDIGPVATERNFYLAGGTAVALHLGHRRSVDLDWFTEERLSDPMQWAQRLRDEGAEFKTESVDKGTLHGSIQGVRVSFLEYRYPLLQPKIHWKPYGADLASLDDLACMKLSAVAQRGSKKDFVDVYALVREHRPLPALVERYRQKYDTKDVAHLLYALVYFDDADAEPMPTLLWDVKWDAIKRTLRKDVEAMAG